MEKITKFNEFINLYKQFMATCGDAINVGRYKFRDEHPDYYDLPVHWVFPNALDAPERLGFGVRLLLIYFNHSEADEIAGKASKTESTDIKVYRDVLVSELDILSKDNIVDVLMEKVSKATFELLEEHILVNK